ncbi:MAG: hypothetical protein M1822_000330 [Bathelium mastoideum]|nr:MAG: hypothetical protein M1822_000330 [Bathelium mastoideum]
MTVDLGLDKAIKLADSELKPIAHNTSDTDAMSPSIRRTHAACCHISSVIAVSFHRKNNFSYPGKLDRHYTPALQGGDDPADNLIFVHIKLQQLVEQAETASKNRQLDALGAATIVDTLTNELYAIFEAMRKEVREQSPIRLAKHFVQLQIQSVALAELRPSAAAPVDSNDVQDWRHATLLRCLESSKAYFETFLSLPVSEYRNMAFADKGRLVLTLTILAKLCFDISGFPRWDSAWARKEVHFGMIIESLCYRMTELTCTGKSQSLYDAALPPDHFFMMKSVLQIVKEVYDEAVAEALDNSEEEQAKRKKASRCPVLNGELMNTDFWEALEHSHESGLDPLLDGNWNLNDSNTWDWDWDWSATI